MFFFRSTYVVKLWCLNVEIIGRAEMEKMFLRTIYLTVQSRLVFATIVCEV